MPADPQASPSPESQPPASDSPASRSMGWVAVSPETMHELRYQLMDIIDAWEEYGDSPDDLQACLQASIEDIRLAVEQADREPLPPPPGQEAPAPSPTPASPETPDRVGGEG